MLWWLGIGVVAAAPTAASSMVPVRSTGVAGLVASARARCTAVQSTNDFTILITVASFANGIALFLILDDAPSTV
jgi:hypothetical protein